MCVYILMLSMLACSLRISIECCILHFDNYNGARTKVQDLVICSPSSVRYIVEAVALAVVFDILSKVALAYLQFLEQYCSCC